MNAGMPLRGNYSPKNIGEALIEAHQAKVQSGSDTEKLPAASIIAAAQILLDPTRDQGRASFRSDQAQTLHDEAFVSTFRDLRQAFGLQLGGLPPKQQQEALLAFANDLIGFGAKK